MFAPPMRDSRARIKYGLSLLGVMNEIAVRPPLRELDDGGRDAMRAAIARAGLLEEGAVPG
jgi:4-hydroxy-tetrahydrodipicolinate synthase